MHQLIKEIETIEDEILNFYIDGNIYYAVSKLGIVLNIIHIVSIQPKINDFNDYFTYLWIEALEGFFILRQRIKEKIAEPWVIEKKIIPKNNYNFFNLFEEEFKKKGISILS